MALFVRSEAFNFNKLLGWTSFFQGVSGSVGMHVAFGVFAGVFLQVHRKTEPTGPGDENSIEKWTIECLCL